MAGEFISANDALHQVAEALFGARADGKPTKRDRFLIETYRTGGSNIVPLGLPRSDDLRAEIERAADKFRWYAYQIREAPPWRASQLERAHVWLESQGFSLDWRGVNREHFQRVLKPLRDIQRAVLKAYEDLQRALNASAGAVAQAQQSAPTTNKKHKVLPGKKLTRRGEKILEIYNSGPELSCIAKVRNDQIRKALDMSLSDRTIQREIKKIDLG